MRFAHIEMHSNVFLFSFNSQRKNNANAITWLKSKSLYDENEDGVCAFRKMFQFINSFRFVFFLHLTKNICFHLVYLLICKIMHLQWGILVIVCFISFLLLSFFLTKKKCFWWNISEIICLSSLLLIVTSIFKQLLQRKWSCFV